MPHRIQLSEQRVCRVGLGGRIGFLTRCPMRYSSALLCLFFSFLLACGDDDRPTDVHQDTGRDTNVSLDTGSDATDMDAPSDAANDALTDAGESSTFQCVRDSDCPTGNCNEEIPGGVCRGCTTHQDCPGSSVCVSGSCAHECVRNDECGAGRECLDGHCSRNTCPLNENPCDGHRCDSSNRCVRWTCDSSCPPGFMCENSYCIMR